MPDFKLVELNNEEQGNLHDALQKNMLQFQKEKTALKFYMLGRGYHLGLKALGFLEKYSFQNPDGSLKLRKDKKTPEMHHMIRIAFSVTQLRGVVNEELCIILALLHDTQEDEQVQSSTLIQEFNQEVATKNWKLTKKFAGEHKKSESFYSALGEDQDCSIVKGLDRCDNLECMIGVFGEEKIFDYCREAEEVYLPMLHIAAKLFPEQQYAYYAIRLRMKRAIKAGRDYATALHQQAETYEEVISLRNTVYETITNTRKAVEDSANELELVENKLQKAYDLTGSGTYEDHERKVKSLIGLAQEDRQERIKIYQNVVKAMSKEKFDPIILEKMGVMIKTALCISELELTDFIEKYISGDINNT